MPSIVPLLQAVLPPPSGTPAEDTITNLVQWLRLVVELTGASVLTYGFLIAAAAFVRDRVLSRAGDFTAIRLMLGRYLALALEFQLGADILSTAIAPSWDQIGKLGAIAVIRTALNFFLMRELREAGSAIAGEKQVAQVAQET